MKSSYSIQTPTQRRLKQCLLYPVLGLVAFCAIGWVGWKVLLAYAGLGIVYAFDRRKQRQHRLSVECLLEDLAEAELLTSDYVTTLTPYGCTLTLEEPSRLQQAVSQTIQQECASAQLPYFLFENVVLIQEDDETLAPFSHLLVTPRGLLVFGAFEEVGEIRGNAKSRQWKLMTRTGRAKELANPLLALQQQARALENYLEEFDFESLPLDYQVIRDPEAFCKSTTLIIPSALSFTHWFRSWRRHSTTVMGNEEFEAVFQSLLSGLQAPVKRTRRRLTQK